MATLGTRIRGAVGFGVVAFFAGAFFTGLVAGSATPFFARLERGFSGSSDAGRFPLMGARALPFEVGGLPLTAVEVGLALEERRVVVSAAISYATLL